MKRRTAGWLYGSIVGLAIVAAGGASAVAGELNFLGWEGYADESFVKEFESATGCKVTATYVGSNDDFAPKLASGGGVYDIVSVSADTTGVLVAAGLVEPLDMSKIEHWNDIYELFRNAKGINRDGQVYGVPLTWGSIPLMYRTDKITEEPDSYAVLWDERYKGKIALWDDKSAIFNTARLLGYDNVYSLTDEQLEAVKQKLIEEKPLLRKYWSTAGELINLYASGEVWISNTWGGYQVAELQKQGIPVKEFLPKEKADGWADNWMIVKGSPNQDCAYQYINFTTSARGQCGISSVTGYSAANPVAAKACMTSEEFEAKHQDDIDYVDSLVMWEQPDRLDVYTNTWNAIKGAE
ncbi:MAG: ABC transporter substrate-binding protein [Hyphomicrobium sp.]|uniref:ABC transporter substrate-binding protein n=1 Tax=Hyphomicrobium sp. TaxID=82 RepID=UPI003D1531FE